MTISKLFRSDTFAAVVRPSPSKSKTGAAMSRTIIATTNFMSSLARLAPSSSLPVIAAFKNINPAPAPRYNSPASIVGEIRPRRSLETGVDTAYSNAAAMARSTARTLVITKARPASCAARK